MRLSCPIPQDKLLKLQKCYNHKKDRETYSFLITYLLYLF